jgi:hypothetical protein
MPRRVAPVTIALVLTPLIVLVVLGLGPAVPPPLAPPAAQAQGPSKYLGAASCGTSKCHGDPNARADFPRLNEHLIWSQKDKHSKAYATLTNENLKSGVSPSKVASKLNVAKPETSDRCLDCHGLNARTEMRGRDFDITEGVQCEVCHGPSQRWLEPHTKKGWSHEQSVAAGMYDTRNPLRRAERCVACHLAIDADMVAAGHPDPVSFELDTFNREIPQHWRDKGTWFSARLWSLGQVVALREAARRLADQAKANAAPKLLQEAGEKVVGHGAMVKHLLAVVASGTEKAVEADVAAAGAAAQTADRAAVQAASAKIVSAMTQQAPKVAGREMDQATVRKIILAVAADAEAIGASGFRAAEQGAMALDRLHANYARVAGANKEAGEALDKVFATIKTPAKYDPKAFAAAVKEFQSRLK